MEKRGKNKVKRGYRGAEGLIRLQRASIKLLIIRDNYENQVEDAWFANYA